MNPVIKIIATAVIAISGTLTAVSMVPENIDSQTQYKKVDDNTIRVTNIQVDIEDLNIDEIKRVQDIFIKRKDDVAKGLVDPLMRYEDFFIEKYQKMIDAASQVGVELKQ